MQKPESAREEETRKEKGRPRPRPRPRMHLPGRTAGGYIKPVTDRGHGEARRRRSTAWHCAELERSAWRWTAPPLSGALRDGRRPLGRRSTSAQGTEKKNTKKLLASRRSRHGHAARRSEGQCPSRPRTEGPKDSGPASRPAPRTGRPPSTPPSPPTESGSGVPTLRLHPHASAFARGTETRFSQGVPTRPRSYGYHTLDMRRYFHRSGRPRLFHET